MTAPTSGADRGPIAWPAIDAELVRFLDLHEARSHAVGGRIVRDLGDAILLTDPHDRDPFWNRLSGLRLPDDPDAFDDRLGALLGLFRGLDRRPHVWVAAGHDRPVDLPTRLASRGFDDLGGGVPMLLVDAAAASAAGAKVDGARVEVHARPQARDRSAIAHEVAGLLVAAFRVDPLVRPRLTADLITGLDSPALRLYVVRADGIAVAAAKRTSLDGASYLSSIGTRPGWRGQGFGALVTAAACRDALAEGDRITYLRVFPENGRARALYERLGFRAAARRAGDFLLAWS